MSDMDPKVRAGLDDLLAFLQARLPDDDPPPASVTCPRCSMTSYHPRDIREGYCGHCHDWTSPPKGDTPIDQRC